VFVTGCLRCWLEWFPSTTDIHRSFARRMKGALSPPISGLPRGNKPPVKQRAAPRLCTTPEQDSRYLSTHGEITHVLSNHFCFSKLCETCTLRQVILEYHAKVNRVVARPSYSPPRIGKDGRRRLPHGDGRICTWTGSCRSDEHVRLAAGGGGAMVVVGCARTARACGRVAHLRDATHKEPQRSPCALYMLRT
jgi:hypothetical protein